MFKIVWPCDFGDWKRKKKKKKKILSPNTLNANQLFFTGESHELVICAPVTSQQLWFPSWMHKRLCLGPGARRSEPEPARWVAGSNLGRGGGGCHRESGKVAEPSCPSHFGWR